MYQHSATRILEGVEKLNEGSKILSQGPLSFYMEELLACFDLLINRFSPYKVGDKVILNYTPVVEGTGWSCFKGKLEKGIEGEVKEIGCGKGGLRYQVVFPGLGTTDTLAFDERRLDPSPNQPDKVVLDPNVEHRLHVISSLGKLLNKVNYCTVTEQYSGGRDTDILKVICPDKETLTNIEGVLKLIKALEN